MPVYNPLDPEAIDAQVDPGLLGQLGRVGLSGVAAVGNFLDTPASMVRDILSFQNPIDNLFNPFSSANRTGGREMLRKYGLVGQEDTYANWWGGFAAEVALDPLTWLGAGALLKGGQALGGGAKGLFRASVPFSGLRKGGEIGFDFATGQGAEAAASVLGDLTSYATKPSKLAPALDKLPNIFSKAAKVQPPAPAAGAQAAPSQVAPIMSEVRPTNDLTGALAAHATGDLPRVPTPTISGALADTSTSVIQEAAKVVDDTPYLPATGMSKFLRNYITEEVDLIRQAPDVDTTGKALAELQKVAMEDFLAWMNQYESKKALFLDVGDNLEVNRLWKAAKEAAAYLDSHDLPAPKAPAAKVVMEAAKVAPAPAAPPPITLSPAPPPTPPPKPTATSTPSVDNPTRIYKAPPKIKEREFVQTLSQEGLMQRQALREHELAAALKELSRVGAMKQLAGIADDAAAKKAKKVADKAAQNLDIINTEIKARAKLGGDPKELQEFVKAGQIKYLDVPEKNIQDASKVLPDSPSPEQVSDWAKTIANILTAPGRALSGLFHAPSLGKFEEVEQGIAARRWELIGQGNKQIRADLSGGISDDIAHYRDAFQEHFGKDVAAQIPDHYQNLANAEAKIRAYGESVLRMAGETSSVKEAFLEHGLDPDKIPEQMLGRMNSLLTNLKDVNAKAFGTYMDVGGAGAVLPKLEGEELVGDLAEIGYFPGFEHMPRFMADTVSHIWGMIGGGMTRPEGSLSRLEPLRAVPAKIVENIGRLVRTGKAGKLKEEDIITAVADKYGKKWLNKEVAKIDEETGEQIMKWGEGDAGVRAHAEALVDWARSSNFDHYMTDNLEANARYLRGIHTATANILAIQEVVQDAAKYAPMVASLPKEQIPRGWKQLRGIASPEEAGNYVSIDKAFSEAGLNTERALKYFAKQLGDDSAEAIAKLKDHVVIPMELAKAIKGSQNIWRLRGYPQLLASIVDIPTRWFKENVTLPFVSFATRNMGSGLYLIASSGNIESLAELKSYGEELMGAFDSFRKQNIPSDKQREWFTEGVLHEGMIFEGVETRQLRDYGHVAPDPINIKETWGEAGELIEASALDRVPGLRQARQAHGTVLGVGGKANKMIEYLLRVPLYEFLKKKGWSNADAAKEVSRLQVDYSKHAFSPFENEVMTRLFPFYKWQRSIAPVVLGTLLRKPAGLMGLTVHGSRLASSDDPRTPEWLGDTLAIENPLGSTEEGGRSYVTGFGLPYEPTLAFFGGGLRGAGREALAQLNPIVKAPLEWSTGQSFFQTGPSGAGRPLDELNPPIGQTLANLARVTGRDPANPVDLPDIVEFAAANSPASRYITTARQITDPRKHPLSLAANLATGARVTDVSPEAQDAILRHRASALTRQLGGRTFSQSYFPSNANLSPAEQGLADQLMELKRLLDQRSRARREAAPTM